MNKGKGKNMGVVKFSISMDKNRHKDMVLLSENFNMTVSKLIRTVFDNLSEEEIKNLLIKDIEKNFKNLEELE